MNSWFWGEKYRPSEHLPAILFTATPNYVYRPSIFITSMPETAITYVFIAPTTLTLAKIFSLKEFYEYDRGTQYKY
jgi:hypothetical protein